MIQLYATNRIFQNTSGELRLDIINLCFCIILTKLGIARMKLGISHFYFDVNVELQQLFCAVYLNLDDLSYMMVTCQAHC